MSVKNAVVVILGLALAAPTGVLAQGARGPRGGPGMGMGPGMCRGTAPGPRARRGDRGPRNPVRCILEWQDLELGEAQASRLRELAQGLDEENASLIERLNELRPERGELRGNPEARQERREQMEPLLQEIRGNNIAAYGSALQVLSEEQRSRVEAVMRPGQGPQGPRGGAAFRGPGSRRGAAMMRRGAMLMRRGRQMTMPRPGFPCPRGRPPAPGG